MSTKLTNNTHREHSFDITLSILSLNHSGPLMVKPNFNITLRDLWGMNWVNVEKTLLTINVGCSPGWISPLKE